MLELIKGLVELWLALFIVFFLHELGHFPTCGVKIRAWFPIPLMYGVSSLFRLGGLAVNLIIISYVFYYRPDNAFIQLCGAVAFIHLIYYFIIGSLYPEPKVSRSMIPFTIFDDVPNEQWFFFIPAAALIGYYLGPFFFDIIKSFLGGIL